VSNVKFVSFIISAGKQEISNSASILYYHL